MTSLSTLFFGQPSEMRPIFTGARGMGRRILVALQEA
jgi:hypothetical protein